MRDWRVGRRHEALWIEGLASRAHRRTNNCKHRCKHIIGSSSEPCERTEWKGVGLRAGTISGDRMLEALVTLLQSGRGGPLAPVRRATAILSRATRDGLAIPVRLSKDAVIAPGQMGRVGVGRGEGRRCRACRRLRARMVGALGGCGLVTVLRLWKRCGEWGVGWELRNNVSRSRASRPERIPQRHRERQELFSWPLWDLSSDLVQSSHSQLPTPETL